MTKDRTETKDLSKENPEKFVEMKQIFNDWVKRVGGKPVK